MGIVPKEVLLDTKNGKQPKVEGENCWHSFFGLGAQGDLLQREAAEGEGEKVGRGSSTFQNEELWVKGLPVDLIDFPVLTIKERCCSRDKERA